MVTEAPFDVVGMASRLLIVALALEEDANNTAILPNTRNFHDLLVSMRVAHEELQASFRQLALR